MLRFTRSNPKGTKPEDDIHDYDYEQEPQGAESFFDLKIDKRSKRFLEAIKALHRPNILEVGMGQGQFLKKIAKLRPDVRLYGVDISKTAIGTARKDRALKGKFIVGDAQRLPFPKNHFNVVVIIDVLEHLDNPSRAILEAKRVLKPGGLFHFYVPCEGQPLTLCWFLRKTNFLGLKNFTKINFGHVQYFSQAEIKKLTDPHFSKIVISYSAHWISQLFHLLTLYLPKKLLFLLGRDTQRKLRDAYKPKAKKGSRRSLIAVLKSAWLILIFPVSMVYEVEAMLLKNLSFGAQGLHFTGQKNTKDLSR